MFNLRPGRTGVIIGCLLLALVGLACRRTVAPTHETPVQRAASPAPSSAAPGNVQLRTQIGFASRQKYLDHYEKHGREFGTISAGEYLRLAQTLRDRPAGKEVLEVVRADGVISRFDQQSGAFLAFNQDLTIRTYFKPNDGVNYFWRQSRR
jgi:pyocin large subunit-like protein